MSGIVLYQPNGAGVLNSAGAQHPLPVEVDVGEICQLSFSGSSRIYRWTLSKPSGSASVLSSANSAGPSFVPDVDGGSYSISLVDIDEIEYVLDIVTPTTGGGGGGGGGSGISIAMEDYAAVRAASFVGGLPPATFVVLRRSAVGDGGEGTFVLLEGDATTADNDGTVLIDSDGNRYRRVYDGAIDDRWFGAVSDTAVDSAPAINAAIGAAWKNPTYDGVANTAGLSVIVSGRRRCASEIHLEGGVTLQGLAGAYYYGASALIFDAGVGDISDTDNGGCLIIDDDTSGPNSKSARGCVVRDLQLVQSHVGYDPLVRCTGIKIKTNCHLENLHVTAFSCDGIDFGGANTNTWSMSGTIRIDRCDRHGLNVHGGETNAGNMAALLDITLCGSVGLYAGGFLGNNYSGAIHTAGNGYSLYNSGANWLFRDVDATAKVWSSAKAVTAGDIILPPVGDRNGWVYMAKTTGNIAAGGGFPAWSTVEGTTFTSGTVTVEVWQREGTSIYSPSGSPLQNQFSWIYAEDDQNPAQLFAGDVMHAAIQDFELDRGAAVRRGTTRGRDLPSPIYTRGDIDGTEWGFFLGVQMGGGFSEPLVAYRYSAGEQSDGVYGGFYNDLGIMYMGRWRPDIKRWASDWSGGSWQGYTQCGGRSLPGPGAMCFNSLWLGPDHLERRLSALPATSGFLPDFTGTVSHSKGAFQEGDFIFNTCGTLDTPTQRYPVGWRTTRFGGGVPQGWSTADWTTGIAIYPGQVVTPSTPNGFVYRAIQTTIGVTHATTEPTWPTSGPATVADNTVTWEFMGAENGSFEPVITQAPTMFSKDVTAGGAIVLSEDDSAHERVKFTGSPGGALSVEVKAGAGTGWVRTFWNASGKTVTVKGSSGDSGVTVLNGDTVNVFSDGTNARPTDGSTFGAISRVARGTPWFSNAAEWAINDDGHAVAQVNTDSFAYWVLDVPHGSLITTVTAFLSGTGHGALPASMPVLTVHEHTISTNGTSTAGTATDGSGSTGVYDAAHVIDAAVSITVDNVDHRYVAILRNEHGANAQVGLDVYMIMVSFTPAAPDRGAA